MERSEVVLEKFCNGCAVEVRDGSLFCYNCGGPVGDEKAVLEATSYSHNAPGMPAANGSSLAGQTRQRSRTSRRVRSDEPTQITWRRDEGPGIGFLIVSLIVAILALALLGIAFYLH